MPKLTFLVAEDYGFLGHRLPMALAAQRAGYNVSVITRVNDDSTRKAIEDAGFTVYPIQWQRRRINPVAAIAEIFQIKKLYQKIQPDLVHHVALKSIIWGTLAAGLSGIRGIVNAPTGMGYIFTSDDRVARTLRFIVSPMLRMAMRHSHAWVIIQNADDWKTLAKDGIIQSGRSVLIRGSGIELERYHAMPEPEGPITVGIAARMLHDKGIIPLVHAQQKLRAEGMDIRLLLAGTPDPENRATLSPSEMADISALPGVTALGQVKDIRTLWAACHIAALPSRREGLPKALMEASAAGRPLVATNVPGCREICQDGVNGILVPVDNVDALAAAIQTLAEDAELRAKYGAESRRKVEMDLSADAVGKKTLDLYKKILALTAR